MSSGLCVKLAECMNSLSSAQINDFVLRLDKKNVIPIIKAILEKPIQSGGRTFVSVNYIGSSPAKIAETINALTLQRLLKNILIVSTSADYLFLKFDALSKLDAEDLISETLQLCSLKVIEQIAQQLEIRLVFEQETSADSSENNGCVTPRNPISRNMRDLNQGLHSPRIIPDHDLRISRRLANFFEVVTYEEQARFVGNHNDDSSVFQQGY